MKLPIRLLILIVLAAVLLSACSVGGRFALVGKWVPEKVTAGQPTAVMEYTAAGKFHQEVDSGLLWEANYQFLDDSTYTLLMPQSQGGPVFFKFQVQGDKLTLTPIDQQTNKPGTSTVLVRVK
jgi:hypothetical protein